MNSLNDIWNSVLAVLGQNLTATALNTWFDDCTPVEIVNNRLVIHTPTEFKRDIIQTRFAQTIIDALSDLFSAEFKLTILAGDELDSYISETKTDDTLPEVAGFTFDNFVVGPSNKYAHAAAIAVAENPGKLYNPLFIYGNSGLGKTHLLLAIGSAIHAKNPKAKIVYVKGDDFTNDLVHAIQVGGGEELRAKYRSADLLLMDDIQFIAGKQQTQEEFFHTFNTLHQANKRIVIASDVPPKDLQGFNERLISRFESGLTVDVKPPDLETRIAILRMIATMNGSNIPNDVFNLIAERFTENIRELEGALNRVTAMASLSNQPVTKALAEQTLQDFFTTDVEIKPADIITQVAKYFYLTFDDIVGRSRTKKIALARQIAMYLVRELTSMSLNDIGLVFGGKDHTTVMHAYTRINDEMQEKQEIYNYVTELTLQLKQRSNDK